MTLRLPLVVLLAMLASWPAQANPRPSPLPRLMLWAWERNEDLRFLQGRRVGVAYLSSTLTLQGDSILRHPRRQPLRVAPGTPLLAVTRVEWSRTQPPTLSAEQRFRIVEEIQQAARLPEVQGVQIDFDAGASMQQSYLRLLKEIRQALPPNTYLSLTALASWCLRDSWLSDPSLPVDEVVPMLFSLGPDQEGLWRTLRTQGDFATGLCRSGLGLSVGGRQVRLPGDRRVWYFNAKPWDLATFLRTLQESP